MRDGSPVLVGWRTTPCPAQEDLRVSRRVSSDAHWPASRAGGTRGQQLSRLRWTMDGERDPVRLRAAWEAR